MTNRYSRLVPIALLLSACAVGPDYVSPTLEPPPQLSAERERGLVDGDSELADWWGVFNDSVLDSLVERCLSGNLDLREALARIQEARALRGIEGTTLYPTIDATGSFTRTESSNETVVGRITPRTSNQYEAGFDASWELDIWGRNRRSIEAAQADLEASVEDARFVLVVVAAEVARNYVELRTFQERHRIAQANVELQAQTLELTQNQFNANLVSQLDVAQVTGPPKPSPFAMGYYRPSGPRRSHEAQAPHPRADHREAA